MSELFEFINADACPICPIRPIADEPQPKRNSTQRRKDAKSCRGGPRARPSSVSVRVRPCEPSGRARRPAPTWQWREVKRFVRENAAVLLAPKVRRIIAQSEVKGVSPNEGLGERLKKIQP